MKISRRHSTWAARMGAAWFSLVASSFVHTGPAPQQGWISRWNLPDPRTTNRVVGMQIDREGNLLIAGDLAESGGATRYLLLKYTPHGRLLWAASHASVTSTAATLSTFVVDHGDNAILTGSTETVKFSSGGQYLWSAHPGGATDVAIDSEDHVFLAGFHPSRYSFAKLTPSGTNLWVRYQDALPDQPEADSVSQRIAVNHRGEIFMGGFEVFEIVARPTGPPLKYYQSALFKYDAGAGLIWKLSDDRFGVRGQFFELYPRLDGSVVITGNWYADPSGKAYQMRHIGADGKLRVETADDRAIATPLSAIDDQGQVYGAEHRNSDDPITGTYGYYRVGKITTDGKTAWEREFVDGDRRRPGKHPRALILDGQGSVIVTGGSDRPGTGADVVTVAYDMQTGNQQWVAAYNGPANQDDEGYALVADGLGNLFLAGTSQNEARGTDVILIKYVSRPPVNRTGTNIELQFPGPPGGAVPIEASGDLSHWANLGVAAVDDDGFARLTDSNVVQTLDKRFYRPRR